METESRPYRVLFLCTGNSARSVFAEYFLRRLGRTRFEVYSAGANPSGTVNPLTVQVLRDRFNIDASGARSKSWDEVRDIKFDFVVTVCDSARESCPVWPGQPVIAHWGVDDPAAFVGAQEEKERFFLNVALTLHRRLQLFTALPLEKLDRLRLEKAVKDIGKSDAQGTDKTTSNE